MHASRAAVPGRMETRRQAGRGRRSRKAKQARVIGVTHAESVAATINRVGVEYHDDSPGPSTSPSQRPRAHHPRADRGDQDHEVARTQTSRFAVHWRVPETDEARPEPEG